MSFLFPSSSSTSSRTTAAAASNVPGSESPVVVEKSACRIPSGSTNDLAEEKKTAMLANMSAAVIGVNAGRGRGGSRRRKIPKHEKNLALGINSRIPWMPFPDAAQVTIVNDIAPQNLFTTSVTVPTFGALTFLVNSLDNFANMATVYDQYRIDEIQVLAYSDDMSSATPGTAAGTWMTVVDLDDSTVPSTMSQLGGYSSVVSTSGYQQHFHSWKPQFAVAAYSGAFTSYSTSTGWLDCASPTVQYYGLKYGSTATAVVVTYTASIRYKVSFRSLH